MKRRRQRFEMTLTTISPNTDPLSLLPHVIQNDPRIDTIKNITPTHLDVRFRHPIARRAARTLLLDLFKRVPNITSAELSQLPPPRIVTR